MFDDDGGVFRGGSGERAAERGEDCLAGGWTRGQGRKMERRVSVCAGGCGFDGRRGSQSKRCSVLGLACFCTEGSWIARIIAGFDIASVGDMKVHQRQPSCGPWLFWVGAFRREGRREESKRLETREELARRT